MSKVTHQRINKKELLFKLKNVIKYISQEDIQELFQKTSKIKKIIEYNSREVIIQFDDLTSYNIWQNGLQTWRNNIGYLHRDNDKPAVIYGDGKKEWYINHRLIKKNYDNN